LNGKAEGSFYRITITYSCYRGPQYVDKLAFKIFYSKRSLDSWEAKIPALKFKNVMMEEYVAKEVWNKLVNHITFMRDSDSSVCTEYSSPV